MKTFKIDGVKYKLKEVHKIEPEEGKPDDGLGTYISYLIMNCDNNTNVGSTSAWDFNNEVHAKARNCAGSAVGKTHEDAAKNLIEKLKSCGAI
jgi:hypothetical protein